MGHKMLYPSWSATWARLFLYNEMAVLTPRHWTVLSSQAEACHLHLLPISVTVTLTFILFRVLPLEKFSALLRSFPGENWSTWPREKPVGARTRTSNKLNLLVVFRETNALTTALLLLHTCSPFVFYRVSSLAPHSLNPCSASSTTKRHPCSIFVPTVLRPCYTLAPPRTCKGNWGLMVMGFCKTLCKLLVVTHGTLTSRSSCLL